jgi:hypothetical protein
VLAIKHLEKQHPQWVNVGCMAHATSLAIKDFCRVIKTPGRFSVTYGIAWMQTVATSNNTIANYVQDSGSAKVIIQRHQVAIYGHRAAIEVNAPTRFASIVFVMRSIQSSSAALKQAASDSAWRRLEGKAGQVKEIVQDADFWFKLDYALNFLQPFSDLIHQIEADRPPLGRCFQAVLALDEHVRASVKEWEYEPELSPDCKSAVHTWERCMKGDGVQALLQPAHIAAYQLDPLYCNVESKTRVRIPRVSDEYEKECK